MRKTFCMLMMALTCSVAMAKGPEVTDPAEAAKDPDFAVQGEYVGEGALPGGGRAAFGAQVIARGNGKFQVELFKGGLPGAGWKRGDDQLSLSGQREGETTSLSGGDLAGKITGGKLTICGSKGKGKIELERVERKSDTLAAKPPKGAVVLFDGTDTDQFEHGRLTELGTLLSGTTTKRKFGSYTLHAEFRLSWMPQARGQGRSNSGVYIHDCYEIQVLDSFGLPGYNNECGGFYKIREPDVNMCLPPLVWQTYDIDFTEPKYDADGKKTADAKITVRHNGVVIHRDVELPHGTPGRQVEGPGPRPIHFQGHGNKVHYRNIWVVEK